MRRAVRPLAALLAVALCYVVLGRLSIEYATMPEGMAVVWLPNALLLSLFLLRPFREWGWIAAAVVPAEVVADAGTFTPVQALQFVLINLGESALSAWLMRRFAPKEGFEQIRYVLLFILIALATVPALSALFGAAVYATQIESATDFVAFWRIWFFGDALGLLIFVPLAVVWARRGRIPLPYGSAESVLTVLGSAMIAAALFSMRFTPSLLPSTPIIFIPLMLWIVYRKGLEAGMLSGFVVSAIAVYFTVRGEGPFSVFDTVQDTLYLQEYIAALMASTLFFGVLLRELRGQTQALEALSRSLEEKVARKTRALQEANDRLQALASTDPLTQLYNRRFLIESAERELSEARRYGSQTALIMLDIDHFKKINDTYGHQAGDGVLICIAQAVKSRLRLADIFARIGGEEFVVLLPRTTLEEAALLAEALKEAITQLKIPTARETISCTVSMGIAAFGGEIQTLDALLADADKKLYRAKEEGRNRIVWA